MPKETKQVLLKKMERIKALQNDLQTLLSQPFDQKDRIPLLAAQRNFELMVELASDINTSLILDKTGQTPDSYREAFSNLSKLGLGEQIVASLVQGAKVRNILAHEYDFDADDEKFYNSAKEIVPVYEKYLEFLNDYLESMK